MVKSQKPKRQLKKSQTVRERAETSKTPEKSKKLSKASSVAKRPLKSLAKTGRKEYYLPLPDNKYGRFFNKKHHFIPSYFRKSWQELKKVQWPNRKQTTQLTIAVFFFAIFLGLLISLSDYGLDKLFRRLIIK